MFVQVKVNEFELYRFKLFCNFYYNAASCFMQVASALCIDLNFVMKAEKIYTVRSIQMLKTLSLNRIQQMPTLVYLYNRYIINSLDATFIRKS